LAARSPQDPNGLMLGRTLFRSADGALDAQLSEAQRLREATGWNELVRLRTFGLGAVIALLGTMLVEMFGIVRPLVRVTAQLAREVAELKRVATTDPVTGTLNRRSFQDRGAIEVQKARRYKRPLSLLMIDTDQLRPINLAHGEAAGEVILRAVTAELSEGTRATDLIARVSGEEFAILLPETDLAGAQLLAERLRRRVSDVTVPVAKDVVACTVSIGVAAVEKDAAFLWPAVKRADEALYEAKMRGRNQVYVNAA
jgi:diguanylate cyclase (GGDEF)-like protein